MKLKHLLAHAVWYEEDETVSRFELVVDGCTIVVVSFCHCRTHQEKKCVRTYSISRCLIEEARLTVQRPMYGRRAVLIVT